MRKNKLEEQDALISLSLVNTSVEDMQSSLGCNNFSPAILQRALEICTRRGERTKATILARKIKKIAAARVAVETEE